MACRLLAAEDVCVMSTNDNNNMAREAGRYPVSAALPTHSVSYTSRLKHASRDT